MTQTDTITTDRCWLCTNEAEVTEYLEQLMCARCIALLKFSVVGQPDAMEGDEIL